MEDLKVITVESLAHCDDILNALYSLPLDELAKGDSENKKTVVIQIGYIKAYLTNQQKNPLLDQNRINVLMARAIGLENALGLGK